MKRAILAAVAVAFAAVPSIASAGSARQILDASGVKGGLIVHLGCGDGKLTIALRVNDSYLVHGLDTDARNVAAARKRFRAAGLCGKVSADVFDGKRLPYADGVVNLVVASVKCQVSSEEIARVLAPRGRALVAATSLDTRPGRRRPALTLDTRSPAGLQGGALFTKPVPQEIDEWTHYLHDASNNAVAHDQRIGPPRRLQWQCGPRWSRHHDHMASVSAVVSARGRVFYILDEGSRVSPQLPSDWKVVARDAFNGVLLWKRDISRWHDRLWPLKSGPANLPRRLVAVGDVVYTTLSIDGPTVALDAATGKTLREYADTAGAEEIVYKDGTLLVVANRTPVDLESDLVQDAEKGKSRDSRTTYSPRMARIWAGIRSTRWSNGDRCIHAFEADTGRKLWEKPGLVLPLTLGADADGAYFHDGEKIVALALTTGKQRWASKPVPVWKGLQGQGLQSWFAPTLVVWDGKVLFAGGEKIHMSYMGWGSKDIGEDTMTALSARTGEKLWTAPHPYSGYNSPEDLFVADGHVWTGNTAKGGGGGRYLSRSLATGEQEKDFPPTVKTHWFHHRCHRAKATDRYILSSRTGIEFIDLKTGEWTIHHWVRGGCLYGIMPCNGLVYSPPDPCACYPEAKLNGFAALAPKGRLQVPGSGFQGERLERGPAYSPSPEPGTRNPEPSDWPAYRHDGARSGATAAKIDAKLRPAWEAKLGGRLTQPVAAGGRLFVADIDRHLVHALEAATGKKQWSFLASGRIDSPPTWWQGRLVFGCADGSVYCVRASDGALAWRFRAAPLDRRLVAFEQLESVWPVHGAVLVQKGIAYAVAGRSMYLDGGLRLCRLDVQTGRLLGETVLDDRDPETGENMQRHIRGLNMPVALPDILASDGEQLYMRSQAMDLEGKRLGLGTGTRDHLFAAYGFTDDSWFHRVYWVYGKGFSGGVGGYGNGRINPAGRILACNDTTVFGYGRKPQYYRWSSILDYQLFAASKTGGGGESSGASAVYFKNTPSLDPKGKPLTLAAWVKPDAKDGTILVRGANLNGFALILTDGKPRMLLRTKGTTHEAVANSAIGSDWTHVAGVLHKDGRMVVYAGGKAVGAAEKVPLLTGEPSIAMKLGFDDTHQLLPKPLAPFSGALDEVMLFHRALSPDEIQRLAQSDTKLSDADHKGQVLHLDFERGKARDRSPCGNHGQMQAAEAKPVRGPVGDALVLEQPKGAAARRRGRGKKPSMAYLWTRDVPIMARAMAVAGDKLLIAGPPDVLDEDAAFQTFTDDKTQKALALQDAALRGKSGAMLLVVDSAKGDTLAEHRLTSPPVFDGLSVAGGRVFIATMDGRVVALAAD